MKNQILLALALLTCVNVTAQDVKEKNLDQANLDQAKSIVILSTTAQHRELLRKYLNSDTYKILSEEEKVKAEDLIISILEKVSSSIPMMTKTGEK